MLGCRGRLSIEAKQYDQRAGGQTGFLTPRLISIADHMTMAALSVYDWRFLMVKIRMIWMTVTKNPVANIPTRTS
jgi:hypothetical protein